MKNKINTTLLAIVMLLVVGMLSVCYYTHSEISHMRGVLRSYYGQTVTKIESLEAKVVHLEKELQSHSNGLVAKEIIEQFMDKFKKYLKLMP